MKKQILLLFSVLLAFLSFAQEYKITFSYDSAGNQIQRNRLCLTCKSYKEKTATDSIVVMAETPKDIEDDLLQSSRITAYPNPVTDILQVEWSSTEKKVDQILLLSFDNKQLFNKKLNPKLSNLDLDFSQYPSGSYIVFVIYSDNSKQSFKVIKK